MERKGGFAFAAFGRETARTNIHFVDIVHRPYTPANRSSPRDTDRLAGGVRICIRDVRT